MTLPEPIKNTDSSHIVLEQTCQRFTLAEIQLATDNFDEALVVGSGGYGKVYKCSSKIGSGKDVAIKRLYSMSEQGASEFEAEVKVLSKLRHGNLVLLIGYCNEERQMILVYEFMSNGTLENHLRKADTKLSWLQRLKICIGAARGLEYLHTGTSTRQGIIHRDVKTSNILLDENFDAKISDFGLAKVGPINQTVTFVKTGVKGTYGYMDPCYFYSGKLTRKTDVYSFGVVLFEVLTGRQAVDPTIDEDQWSLAVWAQDQIKEGKVYQIIDSRLMGEISKKCLKEFTTIACCCLHNQPKRRPTMAEVVVKLESILSQERENAESSANDGRFINKVRSFFTGKEELMLIRAGGRKSITNNGIRTFTMTELRSATNNFNNKECSTTLPRTIYKGWVDERTYAPTESGVGLAMYVRKSPIETLELDIKPEEFYHPNLVKLLGCCLNEKELYCVYELIPYASLDTLLFGEPRTTLSWVARLKIAVGAAKGLSFLHQRGYRGYCQFKTTCILVDKDYNARLWDFEIQKSFEALGSYSPQMDASYAAPECFSYKGNVKFDGILESSHEEDGFGVKNEIYAFGVVLLEILTGMKVYDVRRPLGKQNLVKWAIPLLADHMKLRTIIDPQLQYNTHPPNGAFMLALLVSNCLQRAQEKRPSMDEILQVLCHCYQESSKTV